MNLVPDSARRLQPLLAGLAENAPDFEVAGIAMDSRAVTPGALFLACRGQAAHGLSYLDDALARGAKAVAWEPAPGVAPPLPAVPSVAVERLAQHAGEIAARFYNRPSSGMFVLGVTGTDGKTSTAHLAAQALESLNEPCLYLGTLGAGRADAIAPGALTTPDPVRVQQTLAAALNVGVGAAAMEVSSHALDQGRVSGVEFDVAVLTNLGRDHLDYHGNIAAYAAAKRRLFHAPGLQAMALNWDDAYGRAWAAEVAAERLLVYGIGGSEPDCRYLLADDIELHARGLAFAVRSSWGPARIESRLLGRFNVYNLLAALAALLLHGVPLERAAGALAQARTVPGRIEIFSGPRAAPRVAVDYAHTPQALAAVLQALRPHVRGKLWVVFGCGGDRDRGKRPLMGAAAVQHADHVIVTDDNPRSEDPTAIVADILSGTGHWGLGTGERNIRVIHDRARAIATAVREADAGDIVVVAGKGHEEYQIYGNERRSFSDQKFVAGLVGAGEGTK